MNMSFPERNFLQDVRKLCDDNGIILIYDETITGFRFASGGAQEFFDVIPDLSTFGKGLANGFPLSAVVGKRQIMKEMEEIFFSGTFGGELLSLAAAKAVLEKHKKVNIAAILTEKGENLRNEVESIIKEKNLEKILSLSGHPTWVFLNWAPTDKYSVDELKTFFMQEMFQKGVLILNAHNISLAFGRKELQIVLKAYSETLQKLSEAIATQTLREKLTVEPLVPLFKVR
jgi:glutamate-1-semialdehyde 2,1-aminomutase